MQSSENNKIENLHQAGQLPPGQALARNFPVIHFGSIPGFNPATWRFRVWGEVEEPVEMTWEAFSRLPRSEIVMDLHCVTRWSIPNTHWEGVTLRTLIGLGLIKPLPQANFVIQHAEGGFTANLPLEVMLQDNVLLATHYNGEPITPEHGCPLRGVVGAIPGRKDLKDVYLWKGAKWLRGLEFLQEDKLGFWEQAGYHNSADIWQEQRYRYDR